VLQVLVRNLSRSVFQVLVRKYTIFGCEASLQSFYSSNLINAVDHVPRDALHIYYALKTMCTRDGHMYVPLLKLKGYCHLKNLTVRDWNNARKFLLENEVTVEEEIHGTTIIYLHRYWLAEQNVAQFFTNLWRISQTDPWTFDVDFDW